MIALERVRQNGFIVRPAGGASLYIEPISELDDDQRQWLISNKVLIRQQLLDERWEWFLSLATEHSIHPDVVGAEFPDEADKLDVIVPATHSDELLRRWMAVLCSDPRVQQRQREFTRRKVPCCLLSKSFLYKRWFTFGNKSEACRQGCSTKENAAKEQIFAIFCQDARYAASL